jgi:tetratricopeptide (TPR) repeat protein
LQNALQHCRKALGVNPGLRQVRFDFAANLAASGDKDAAIEEYTRLLAIDPSYAGAQTALENLKR